MADRLSGRSGADLPARLRAFGKLTATALASVVVLSCAAPRTAPVPATVDDAATTPVRVMLAAGVSQVEVVATGAWYMLDPERRLMARVGPGERWRIEYERDRVRGVRGTVQTGWVQGPIYAVMTSDGFLSYGNRRYRGELMFRASTRGVVVINRVRMDDYLAGVVPLEIGNRPAADSAAVQAQAIAARSYAFTHLDRADSRGYDVTATVADQVYGGVEVETAVATRAIASTRGLVLRHAGRVVNAPYSSTCGGQTARASEVWRSGDEPYLVNVSDRIPGTDRHYCDMSPRFRWTRTFDQPELVATVNRYLSTVISEPVSQPGRPRAVAVAARTLSDRVGELRLVTDRGSYTVRGNDVRYLLRTPGGEILSSTYFSVDSIQERDGYISRLTLRGGGYGHGVGMCQYGAIGRARAGHSFREIIAAYYPGTSIGPAR